MLWRFIRTKNRNTVNKTVAKPEISSTAGLFYGFIIGSISPLLGIGGGTISTPLLDHYKISLPRIIGISCIISATIAVTGTLSSIYTGWHQPHLPTYSFGYVYWPAALSISTISLISIRSGVYCAHRFNATWLKRLFICLLIIIIIKSFIWH